MINNDLNICILVVDSMRADHLSCYGYKKITSPNIDSISQNSLLFQNAISQSNWTYPSLYSLISGKYPTTHGVKWFNQRIDESFITLPEILERHGYRTAIFSSFRSLINPHTFGKHFIERKLIEIDGEDTLKSLAQWFKNNQRSFSIFHIGDYVHEPYYADRKYVDMFYQEGYKGLKFDDVVNSIISKSIGVPGEKMRDINRKLNLRIKKLSRKQLAYLIACYDAGIYRVDKFIGEFYEIIQRELQNYLFIITADHGQSFFEHYFYGHGFNLHDEVIKIPLIIDMKQRNKVVYDQVMQHIDIYPTLLELLGIKMEMVKLDGNSFSSVFLSGEIKPNDRFAVSESHPFISIRNKSHKLITTHFRLMGNNVGLKELYANYKDKKIRRFLFNCYALLSSDKFYNLLSDKKEQNNLKGHDKTTYTMLSENLKTIFQNAQQQSRESINVNIDEGIKQELENLGYM